MVQDVLHPAPSSSTDFGPLLAPRSIAVVGASDNPRKLSGRPVAFLKRFGYEGRILPVNPVRSTVQGIPAYLSVDQIDGEIDVALLVVPAEKTPDATRACVAAGVRFVIATAAGFSEASASGADLEAEMLAALEGSSTRLIGPNTLGMIGVRDGAVPTFSGVLEEKLPLRPGPVAFVSQSGAFGSFIFGEAQAAYVRMSHYLNTGNEADLTVADLLGGLVADDETRVLLAYLEGVSHGRRLLEVARAAHLADKPIIAVKSGRSEAGARAAASHTASLAGDDQVFDDLVREAGVVRVEGQEPLLDAAQVFDSLRRTKGRRLTILSESGGAAVLSADAASAAGLVVEPWSSEWQAKLAAEIPDFASARNPVDLTGQLITDPSLMRAALRLSIEHPDTDLIMVLVGNADMFADPIIDALTEYYDTTDRPIAVVWTGGTGEPRIRLRERGIPCFTDPGRAARALGKLADYSLRPALPHPVRPGGIDVDLARAMFSEARAEGRRILDEAEAGAVLRAYGIPVASILIASSPDETVDAAATLGGPVVVKVLSSRITHKSDIGGVVVGLTDPEDVRRAGKQLLELAADHGEVPPRVLVQAMATGDAEMILGAKVDDSYGPLVVVGLGGIFVELLGDSQIAAAPTDRTRAETLIRELRGAALLTGTRGRPALAVDAAADAVERLSWLVADLEDEIAEVDVNPLLLSPDGVVAVDALMVLNDRSKEEG